MATSVWHLQLRKCDFIGKLSAMEQGQKWETAKKFCTKVSVDMEISQHAVQM